MSRMDELSYRAAGNRLQGSRVIPTVCVLFGSFGVLSHGPGYTQTLFPSAVQQRKTNYYSVRAARLINIYIIDILGWGQSRLRRCQDWVRSGERSSRVDRCIRLRKHRCNSIHCYRLWKSLSNCNRSLDMLVRSRSRRDSRYSANRPSSRFRNNEAVVQTQTLS